MRHKTLRDYLWEETLGAKILLFIIFCFSVQFEALSYMDNNFFHVSRFYDGQGINEQSLFPSSCFSIFEGKKKN